MALVSKALSTLAEFSESPNSATVAETAIVAEIASVDRA